MLYTILSYWIIFLIQLPRHYTIIEMAKITHESNERIALVVWEKSAVLAMLSDDK